MLAGSNTDFHFQTIISKDIDDFSEKVFPRDFHLKTIGKANSFGINSKLLLSEGFLVTFANLQNTLHHTGSSPKDMRTYLIQMDQQQHIFWKNQELNQNEIGINDSGSEIDTISKGDSRFCVVSISEKYLEERATLMGMDWISLNIYLNKEYLTLHSHQIGIIRKLIFQLLSLRNNIVRDYKERLAFHSLKNQIIDFLITSYNDMPSECTKELSNRERIFKRFNEYVFSSIGTNYDSREMCIYTGASERTLQYIVKYFTQLSPIQYAKAIKLNKVHEVLRKCDPESLKINQIALEYGFWHSGQFAKDFKNQFGVLPSETLA